jgi:hypothetical protein
MSISSTIEERARHREPSETPAKAAAEVLGADPREGTARFGRLAHWAYGSSWGAVRGLLGFLGLQGSSAAATHLGLVWGGEQLVLLATGASDPAWKWELSEIAVDLLHHGVYAAASSAAYGILEPWHND